MEQRRFDSQDHRAVAPPVERLMGAATRMGVLALQGAKAAGLKDKSLTDALLNSAAGLTAVSEIYAPSASQTTIVRIKSPVELVGALAAHGLERLEAPISILDHRWREPEIAAALDQRGDVMIHAYDIFLRGLLTTKAPAQWPLIDGVNAGQVIAVLDHLTQEFRRQSRADFCLAYVRGLPWVDGVLVDPASDEEWETITRLSAKPPLTPSQCATVQDIMPRLPSLLLNPSLWP